MSERYKVIETADGSPRFSYAVFDTQSQKIAVDGYNNRMSELTEKAALHWSTLWNKVEDGHCGMCERKISEIPEYQRGANGEEPREKFTYGHALYKRLCFTCSCSLDD